RIERALLRRAYGRFAHRRDDEHRHRDELALSFRASARNLEGGWRKDVTPRVPRAARSLAHVRDDNALQLLDHISQYVRVVFLAAEFAERNGVRRRVLAQA